MLKRILVYVPLAVLILWGLNSLASVREYPKPTPLPEFTHTEAALWLNSPPLSVPDLHGKVVIVDFWTFGCWNCYRSFPWLNDLYNRYHDQGLEIIGVHTPEFDHEKDLEKVQAKVKEFELHHPVMIDNDFSYWNRLNNRFWPAYYIVDKQGNVRGLSVGETHKGDPRAKSVEDLVMRLLAE